MIVPWRSISGLRPRKVPVGKRHQRFVDFLALGIIAARDEETVTNARARLEFHHYYDVRFEKGITLGSLRTSTSSNGKQRLSRETRGTVRKVRKSFLRSFSGCLRRPHITQLFFRNARLIISLLSYRE